MISLAPGWLMQSGAGVAAKKPIDAEASKSGATGD
jgi:hypothetical protein